MNGPTKAPVPSNGCVHTIWHNPRALRSSIPVLATVALCTMVWLGLGCCASAQEAAGDTVQDKRDKERLFDEYLQLGTEQGVGGADWQRVERSHTKDLIRAFIPPLLRPAFVGHAFVLPPNAWQVSVSGRFTTIDGNDFFKDFKQNKAVFRDFDVDRQFADLDLFYGFDLGTKGLHNFTARINVPFRFSQTKGFIHPDGFPLADLFTESESSELGDVGLFLKKKFLDQAEFPIQIAGAIGLRFPTGSNHERFVDGGRIKMRRPDPTMGTGQPGRPPLDTPLPLSVLGGLPKITTPFMFNCPAGRTDPSCGTPGQPGAFWRFSDDGRLPSVLQPGAGDFSFFTGLFFTRVNQAYSLLGRSAFHWGATHTFKQEADGVDPGDETVTFASFVKPVIEDLIAFDLAFVAFHQEGDSYKGSIFTPMPTDAAGNPVASWDVATHVTFREGKREPFVKGWTGFIAPSLILSPDPSIRLTASSLVRILEPELGPAPDFVVRAALEVIF